MDNHSLILDLCAASACGDLSAMQYLISSGVEHQKSDILLIDHWRRSREIDAEMVRRLVAVHDLSTDPLFAAITYGQEDASKMLLHKWLLDTDVQVGVLLRCVTDCDQWSSLRSNMAWRATREVMRSVTKSKNKTFLDLLIHLYLDNGAIVDELLEVGVDLNKHCPWGQLALIYALDDKRYDLCCRFLLKGALPDRLTGSGSFKESFLHVASQLGQYEMISRSLDLYPMSNVNVLDEDGDTPLHRAILTPRWSPSNRLATLKVLIGWGADPSIMNCKGFSVMDYANGKYPDWNPRLTAQEFSVIGK